MQGQRKTIFAVSAVVWLGLSCAALALWPVDVLEIHLVASGRQVGTQADEHSGKDGTVFSAPMPLGAGYETSIIHSVQLTPVVDRYRVQEGRIWGWQELIKSHNAGLPALKPERGSFRHEPPWMILEGGGHSWEEIHYRVGTRTLGANMFCFPGQGCSELWRVFPGHVLRFSVTTVPLCRSVGHVASRLALGALPLREREQQ